MLLLNEGFSIIFRERRFSKNTLPFTSISKTIFGAIDSKELE